MFAAPRNPNEAYPRPESRVALMRHLGRPLRWHLIGGALAGIAWMVLQGVTPWALGRTVDALLRVARDGDSARAVIGWAGVLAGLGVAIGVSAFIRHTLAVRNWMGGALPSIRCVGHHTSRVGANLPSLAPTGDIMNVASDDSNRIGNFYELFCRGSGAIASLVFVVTVALSTSWKLGLVVLVGVPIIVGVMASFSRTIHARMADQRARSGDLVSLGADGVSGLRILRGVGGEEHFLARYTASSQDVRASGVRIAGVGAALAGLHQVLPALLIAVLLWFGVDELRAGHITAGDLVAFLGYAAFLVLPFRTLDEMFLTYLRSWVAFGKLRAFLALPTRQESVDVAPTRHDDVDRGDLADPTTGITATDGHLTVVVCENPAVSADAAYRMARLAPRAGERSATIGGTPLADWPLDRVRQRIALSDSEPQLLSGTLRSQLDPLKRHTDAQCLAALRVACADDILDLLPDGLSDYVTEKGRSLSGGQRQRVALARAVLRDAGVLILVEPTSAVDAHTELSIARRLAEHRRGRTTLVTSTSPLLCEAADRIVFVHDDEPCVGTHAHLLDTVPAYRAVVGRDMADDVHDHSEVNA